MTEVREQKREIREEFGAKNALARIVRHRWPRLTIECIRAEWDLTDAEARGVNYAQASQRTIDKILKHPRGGWRIGLLLLEHTIGHGLMDFINSERGRLEEEERRAKEEGDVLAAVADRAAIFLRLKGGLDLGDRSAGGR